MDEILHTPREESSAIRPPLAQLRDRWEAGTAALAQRVEPLRRRLDAATAGGRRLIESPAFPGRRRGHRRGGCRGHCLHSQLCGGGGRRGPGHRHQPLCV